MSLIDRVLRRRYVARMANRRERLKMRGERIRSAYERAAQDTEFQADMMEIERAFEPALKDGLEPTSMR